MWVARDEDNKIFLYEFKPERHYDKWYDWDNGSFYGIIELNKLLFPELKWEDEPIEVEIIKKLYRVEDVCIGCHNDKCDECYYKDKFKK